MGQIARFVFGVEGFASVSLLAVLWVWSRPYLSPIVADYPGPFTSAWTTVEVVVPILIGAYYLLLGGYIVFGPVQQERARDVQQGVRRRR